MAMPKSYSESVKSRIVHRMVGPNAVSAHALAPEVGIHQSTLSRWLRESDRVRLMSRERKNAKRAQVPNLTAVRPKRPEDWAASEKLQAVMEASQIAEAGLGEWLRRKGLHETHLCQWRDAVVSAAEDALAGSRPKRPSAEGRRVKELERELKRKDRALAETAALLVLRKKADALWGDEDASTGLTNDDEFSR
jgi:transposase